MGRRRTLGACLAFAVAAATAGRAAAADDETLGDASPPSIALVITGVAVAIGGGALQYVSAQHLADSVEANVGWLALSGVGSLTADAGGALVALWGWRLGENHFVFDSAGGRVKERRTMALTAMAVGAAAFLAAYAAQIYVFSKTFQCDARALTSGGRISESCAHDAIITGTIVQLAANGVVLAVAPIAGYGFGYDTAARRAAEGHGFRYSLAPALFAGGAGVQAVGRF